MADGADPLAQARPFTPKQPEGIPDGFRLRHDGIYKRDDTGDDGPEWVWMCSPIVVLAMTRDGASKGWGRLVEITDSDGCRHRWSIPAEMFAGDGLELRREAMRLGLRLANKRGSRTAFLDMLQGWTPETRATTATRLGWADEGCRAFVLGNGDVLGDETVVYQTENAPGTAAEMKPAGDLDRWRETVAAPCIGNPLLVASVALAFAGPLLDPLTIEGGGLHLRGASSRGKSTLQRMAVSVWGSPGFLHSWRATANGLEGVATACNGSLVALDELGAVNGREAGHVAYMLANGQGKARGQGNGGARPVARWRTAILSSGEISLTDKMAEAGERAKAGQEVRLLDVQADGRRHGAFDDLHGVADAAAFADGLNRAAATAYGTAGPAFVSGLLDDFEGNLDAIRAAMRAFEAEAAQRFALDGDGQTARAAKRLGLIAAAGEAATALGLTGWPEGEAHRAALEVLGLWLDGRGGAGPAEAREAVERVRAFLSAHGGSRFERIRSDGIEEGRTVRDRAGWVSDDLYYITVDAWREIHRGSDPKRAARHVREAGFLYCEELGKMAGRTPRGVPGRPRAYAVTPCIMGGGEDDR